MMKQIMKRAHEIAKELEGDYMARMSIALRTAWAEAKAPAKKAFKGSATVSYQVSANVSIDVNFKLWENYGKRRIYFEAPTTRAQSAIKGYIDLSNDNQIIISNQRVCNINKAVDSFMATYAI